MTLSEILLYKLAKAWPSPMTKKDAKLAEHGASDITGDSAAIAYTYHQYENSLKYGILVSIIDKDVLEVACGHGGKCCFFAAAGAKSVIGIDLNENRFKHHVTIRQQLESHYGGGAKLPLSFKVMNAEKLEFEAESFDVVMAPNCFEHFVNPDLIMKEAYRVLRPGGRLVVIPFSSIYSKHGPHLKYGIKLPWVNLFFSEKTSINVLQKLAQEDERLYEIYPGLKNSPKRYRDLREFGDLNDITYPLFKKMARETGFNIELFKIEQYIMGKILKRLFFLKDSILLDIFSMNATSVLRKPLK